MFFMLSLIMWKNITIYVKNFLTGLEKGTGRLVIICMFLLILFQFYMHISLKNKITYYENERVKLLNEIIMNDRDMLVKKFDPMEKTFILLGAKMDNFSDLWKQVRDFVVAFKAPNIRAIWGEMSLDNLFQQLGLSGCLKDYSRHPRFQNSEGKLSIPDYTLKLPNDVEIMIDCKTPEGVVNANISLEDTIKAIKNHIKCLAEKKYWELTSSPSFTIMFIPNDALLMRVLNEEPNIINHDPQIILASQSSLLCIMKLISVAWKNIEFQRESENMRQVMQEGYQEIDKLSDHIQTISKYINQINTSLFNLDKQFQKVKHKLDVILNIEKTPDKPS
jgi:DNA anti-recombination protein RmuC